MANNISTWHHLRMFPYSSKMHLCNFYEAAFQGKENAEISIENRKSKILCSPKKTFSFAEIYAQKYLCTQYVIWFVIQPTIGESTLKEIKILFSRKNKKTKSKLAIYFFGQFSCEVFFLHWTDIQDALNDVPCLCVRLLICYTYFLWGQSTKNRNSFLFHRNAKFPGCKIRLRIFELFCLQNFSGSSAKVLIFNTSVSLSLSAYAQSSRSQGKRWKLFFCSPVSLWFLMTTSFHNFSVHG